MKTNHNIVQQDPWTLNDLSTMNDKDEKVFLFQQNGKTYKFLKNSMVKAFEHNGMNTRNPYTREILPKPTLNRLVKFQTLTTNESDMLHGVNSMLREIKFTYKNNNELSKIRRKVANNYIENMRVIGNNNKNYNRIKKNLMKKGRL